MPRKKTLKDKYELTELIRSRLDLLLTLEKEYKRLSSGFFRLSAKDSILFIEKITDARSAVWNSVYAEYPELRGQQLLIDMNKIEVKK